MKARNKAYRHFNLTFLIIALSGLLSIGLFNVLVDPYGVARSPIIPGFNNLKPEQFNHVRLFKAVDVIRLKPTILLLGSSRTDLGLDPKHPALANQSAYNLGLVGPNMYEVRRYFEHALTNQPEVKTVVLGIDFFMFNEYLKNSPDFDENRLNQKYIPFKDAVNVSFSTSALSASKNTIKSSVKSEAHYLYQQNGKRYVHNNKPKDNLLNVFKDSIKGFFETEGFYKEYKLSQDYLNDLKKIVETCRERNIELKIFISPEHATQLEAVKVAGLWTELENWQREVVKIAPVWDFTGYNSITTELISNTMQNYWDSSHYRKEVGDLILNRLFQVQTTEVPDNFGILITPETIETHLQNKRAMREAWAKENPTLIQLVHDLK